MGAVPMKSYHFDVGNSSEGHIGLCARVQATSEDEALEKLKDALVDMIPVPDAAFGEGIEYINVYINPPAFKVEDIDEVDDVEDEDEVR